MATPENIQDEVPSSLAESRFNALFDERLDHEVMRRRVTAVVHDFVNSVDFMKKVREYAAMEMDSRLFRSAQYWITTIVTALITTAIGFFAGKIWH